MDNKRADELAKKGADTPYTGPEPVLDQSYSVVKRAIGDWMERKHTECWKSSKDCKLSKTFLESPQQSKATKLLSIAGSFYPLLFVCSNDILAYMVST